MRHSGNKGFSLTEVLIVVGLLGVIATIAVVSMSGLSGSIKYKNTAWGISSQLRLAKQMAVTNNREERVEFGIGAGQYRLTEGNLPAGSTVWVQVKPWTAVDQGVALATGAACNGNADVNIKFNPNGTADAGTICVNDTGGAVKYTMEISSTSGRVAID
ncbi:MAG: prepilin-type N-terminal cleavage/methylation domain-containing protein [Deltaproteobacteria bacterium]|nr:prepilin-type N-terminal cleavage/methylation domain-containing protein [Deltaproteobacteria bacterium]